MNPPCRPKLGLLALTMEFYERLAPELRPEREAWVREKLLGPLRTHADIAGLATASTAEAVASAVAQFEADGADALILVFLTYSPSLIALPALKQTRLPLLLWNTQELFELNSSFSPAEMRRNHGLHGTQDLANVLLREGVGIHYLTGHASDAATLDELVDFAFAAAAANRFRCARVGLLGYPFPGMGDIAVSHQRLHAELGCCCVELSLDDFFSAVGNCSAKDVGKLVADYQSSYEIAQDVTRTELEATVRAELALRVLLKQEELDAFSYQFLAFGEDERSETLPFAAACRLMADGFGFGGEGDVIGALGHALLSWVRRPASFCEMFTCDFAGNSVLMSHMGEVNVAMAEAKKKPLLVARATPITRTRERQLALLFPFKPGPATLASLTQGPGGRWRLLASPVEIADFAPLPQLTVPHFKMRPQGDVRDFLTRYARCGGPHHQAICLGDARRRLKMAASLLSLDYCEF